MCLSSILSVFFLFILVVFPLTTPQPATSFSYSLWFLNLATHCAGIVGLLSIATLQSSNFVFTVAPKSPQTSTLVYVVVGNFRNLQLVYVRYIVMYSRTSHQMHHDPVPQLLYNASCTYSGLSYCRTFHTAHPSAWFDIAVVANPKRGPASLS